GPAYDSDAGPFAAQVRVRYLQVAANAIHTADPNHLYLVANLQFDAAASGDTALAWSVPDVASVQLATGQKASDIIAAWPRVSSHPLLLQVSGCQGGAPAGLFAAPAVVGYVWNPSGDWQSG